MPPETSPAPAQLLERLLIDSDFRVKFRKDPVGACRAFGLDDLADQMTGQGKSMQTLEIRESKSSLAGVLMAAAAEAVGVIELVRYAQGDGPLGGEAVSAVRQALSSPRLQAISMSQIQAIDPTSAPGAPPVAPDATGAAADAPGGADDAAALREDMAAASACPDCGSAVVSMGDDVTICSNCGLRQNGVRMQDLSADDRAALREDLAAAGACADCGKPVATSADGTQAPCLFCGSLGAGAAHLLLDQDLPATSPDAAGAAASAGPQELQAVGARADEGSLGDQPTGRALGEEGNEPTDRGTSEKQSAGKAAAAPPGEERIQAAGGLTGPPGADEIPKDGGRGGAALPRDEPIRAGQSAAAPSGRVGFAGATLQVGAVRAAPGTVGDPPQSLAGSDRPDANGGDRIEALADVAPAPAAAPGVPVAPIDASLTAGSNANGALHGSEFDYQDAEGAPFGDGTRRHAGYDLFGEAGAPVRSPVTGTIVEVRASRGNSGQIFGGTVKVQGPDGQVWVFRHVDPASVTEGQQIVAGQQVASVTAWTDGTPHTHIERWKTYEGGYNGDNMIDPLPELTAAYTGQAPPGIPPEGLAPGQTPGAAVPGAVEAAVAADPQVLYQNAVQALLDNPKVTLPEGARADLQAGVVDARLVLMLTKLSEKHTISLSVIKTGHDQFVAGTTTESNHFSGRGLDIAVVDGERVDSGSPAARVLAQELGQLGPPLVPDEIGSPFPIGGPPFFTDGAHQDHIHVGFDSEIPPGTVLPFEQPATPAQPAAAAAAALDPSEGRASGVFAAVAAVDAQGDPGAVGAQRGMTVKFMPAIVAPAAAPAVVPGAVPGTVPPATPGVVPVDPAAAPQPQAQPIAASPSDVPPGSIIPSDQFDPGDITPHPGPTASKEAVAQWMAVNAQKVGLPAELPVMAGITESGLRYGLTPDVSDADSGGYFQMRVSIWNIPPWTNYMNEPEKQLHWFLSQALALKEKRIGEGFATFGQDPAAYGEWCADVERPAAEYRDRYQTHFEEARQLIFSGQPQPAPVSG